MKKIIFVTLFLSFFGFKFACAYDTCNPFNPSNLPCVFPQYNDRVFDTAVGTLFITGVDGVYTS